MSVSSGPILISTAKGNGFDGSKNECDATRRPSTVSIVSQSSPNPIQRSSSVFGNSATSVALGEGTPPPVFPGETAFGGGVHASFKAARPQTSMDHSSPGLSRKGTLFGSVRSQSASPAANKLRKMSTMQRSTLRRPPSKAGGRAGSPPHGGGEGENGSNPDNEKNSMDYWRKMLKATPMGVTSQTFGGKLDRLHVALTDRLVKLHELGHHRSVTDEAYRARHGKIKQIRALKNLTFSGEGSVDFGKLEDVKCIFEHVWGGNPVPGLTDSEFTTLVAPLLCRTYPNGVEGWVATIDDDSAGYIDWLKFSAFLTRDFEEGFHREGEDKESGDNSPKPGGGLMSRVVSAPSSRAAGSSGGSAPVGENADGQYHTVPEGYDKAPTGYRNSKCIYNPIDRNYYAYCSDGCVRKFDGDSLNPTAVIHYHDKVNSVDMKINAERELLYVAQDTGRVYLYDISGEMHRTGNLLKAFQVTSGSHGESHVKKTLPYDPLRMEMVYTGIARKQAETVNLKIPVVGWDTKSVCSCAHRGLCNCKIGAFGREHQLNCIEPTRSLFPATHQQTNRDPFLLCGFEGGHVGMYRTEIATSVGASLGNKNHPAVSVWQPHTSWVTKIMVTTTHREMNGWVSSSRDGSIQVMDCAKQETSLRLVDSESEAATFVGGALGGTEGGWTDGVRPVSSFDISQHSPLIASCSNMRVINLWSPITRRKVACFGEHKHSVVDVAFNNEMHQLISLGDDRTIRVWDMRTLRCIQVIADKERRRCQEHLTALTVNCHRNAIVACGGTPFLWKNLAQEMRKELGVEQETFGTGHTDRVRDVVICERTGHCVTSDGQRVLVWSLSDFALVREINPRGRTMSILVRDRQLFTGSDNGFIQVWSHVSGKELRLLHGGTGPCTALSTLPHSTDDNFIHSCIVAGFGGHVLFFTAKPTAPSTLVAPSALISVPVEDALFFVDAVDELPSQQHANNMQQNTSARGLKSKSPPREGVLASLGSQQAVFVTSIAASKSCRTIVVGLNSGKFSIIALSNLTGPQLSTSVRWLRPVRQIHSAADKPFPKHNARPASSGLWKKAAEAVRTTEVRTGSADFTKFRHSAQQASLTAVESVLSISSGDVLVAFGNGDGCLYSVEGAPITRACFPLSFTLGEPACITYSRDTERVYTGEAKCRITTFNVANSLSTLKGRGEVAPIHRREYHNNVDIQLLESTSFGSSLINAVAICPTRATSPSTQAEAKCDDLLLVGLESSTVILVDALQRVILQTLGAPHVTPIPFPSTFEHHRFLKLFPDHGNRVDPGELSMSTSNTAVTSPAMPSLGMPDTEASQEGGSFLSSPTSGGQQLEQIRRRFPYLATISPTNAQGGKSTVGQQGGEATSNSEVEAVVSQKTVQALMIMNEHKESRARIFGKVSYKHLHLSNVSFSSKK